MDLFTPVVEQKLMHPNFQRLLSKHASADREVLIDWVTEFRDRDGKFVKEFQTTFNPGFWELYLFACCKNLGFKVNLKFSSPDFVIENFLNEFCIEAVTASNAVGEAAEWERDLKTRKEPDPEEVLLTASIRLSNAIQSKHSKYLKQYQRLKHVQGKPFILAVAPFEQPYFFAQNDHAIRQVLYGYDRKLSDGTFKYTETIRKKSGSPIPMGIFKDNRMAEISAVIFSNTATMSKIHALNEENSSLMFFSALRFNHHGHEAFLENCAKADYRESLLDGLYVFHNPHARIPLAFDTFNHDDIAQGTLLSGHSVPRYKCKHGHLMQRSSLTIRPRDPQQRGEARP